MAKMRAGKPPKPKSKISAGVVAPSNISFSFQYLDKASDKFDYSKCESSYFCKVIERLSALCTFNQTALHADRTSSLRAHPIDWRKTSEPGGFAHLHEQLWESKPYQFSISSNAHGRVHGFFIDSVFYVVWLDPEHQLYPGKK